MGAAQRLAMPMRRGFTRTERYLARLPNGIHSYPECLVRATVYRSFVESRSLRGFDWEGAHPRIASMLRTAVADSEWIPTVVSTATVLAVADHLDLDDAGMMAWIHNCNQRALARPMFATLLSLTSPNLWVRHSARRWQAVHRGTGFGATLRDGGADATVTFPPFLFPEEILHGHGDGICTALSMSRAKRCTFEVVRITPRSCEYRFDWG